jgi:hypothetical protein
MTSISNAFNKNKVGSLAIKPEDDILLIEPQYLVLKCSSLVSSPTTLTIRICTDTDCDDTIFPDTTATLALGVTTTTEAGASWAIEVPIFEPISGTALTYYLVAKTDTGTLTVDSATLYSYAAAQD